MEKKNYEVTMVIECKEGAEKYIAQSVCDGLEEPTCVKHINITETPSMNVKLNGLELEYLKNLMTKDIYKMMDNNVSFENGFIDKLNSKLIVLTKTK